MSDAPQPIVLLDSPEDGYCEETGWVEATVDQERARDLLAEFRTSEDGDETPFRPVGAVTPVKLVPASDPAKWGDDPESEFWCERDKLGPMATDERTRCLAAVKDFWQVQAYDD